MIARRLFMIGISSMALSACGGNLLGPPDAGPMYMVAPKFAAQPAGGQKVTWALAILRPNVSAGLDTDRIALTQPDGTMDYYARATYPDRLPNIVQQAVLDGFEASGRIDKVAREEDALHADYNLAIELKDFAAHYSQQDGIPSVTVAITVKLTTAHGRDIVGSFSSVQTGNASVNSAGAAAQALQQALGAAVTQIVNWTLMAPAPATQQPAATSPGEPAEELLHDVTRGTRRAQEKPPSR
ncbi:MAG TPA: ABC-type transport auxiliary lipoprotein family protein [Rhizomicrobium sp.]|nr:ABC-type transport auxiliary lipoprotein family protein [Rhizomicrobium sp.]